MTDRYQSFANSAPGRMFTKRLGLPAPPPLRRYEPGQPVLDGSALLGAAPGGLFVDAVAETLRSVDAEVSVAPGPEARGAGQRAGARASAWSPEANGDRRFAALVFDASGIREVAGLRSLYEFFHPVIWQIERCGRLVILGTQPELCEEPAHAIAQRALEGFVRSAGKEVGSRGATANLVYAAPGAEHALESTLRFFLSARSAYVSGQAPRLAAVEPPLPADWERPLDGRAALVTGASRGIGETIAEVLARDGAHVVCLDVPAQGEALAEVANRVGGSALQLDITGDDAPRTIADHMRERHGGADVVVHNAGVTRDRTLGKMSEEEWDTVMAINLESQIRINDLLLGENVLRQQGRIVGVASVSGIAGNRGQANYATSKAGVIGVAESLAPVVAERPATINAVAPGFIETKMTAAMPITTREAGRRMNSLTQGGLPVDVAETVAWLASPGSAGVNGNVVRVCGQSFLGA